MDQISKKLEKWREIINNGREEHLPRKEYLFDQSFKLKKVIDECIVGENKKKPRRTYLGGSSLGEECARRIQYRFMGTESDHDKEFSARTLRIFEFGHIIEEQMALWLRQSGFDLRTENKEGKQFGFSIADDQIKGHIDGVICSGPEAAGLQYPMLWECKSANDRKFKEFVRDGMARTNPVYAAQVALYQAYMDLTEHPALFTVINKNTSDIYYELVEFDKSLAQKISDRAVDIIKAVESSTMMPRIAHNNDYFTCKMCEFHMTCWQ